MLPLFPQRIPTGDGSYVVATGISNQMQFISPKLGISFLYLNTADSKSPKTLTKQESDKVYIYEDFTYPGFDYHQEEYVEVFRKSPSDDLETAIKKTILRGYSEQDCFVQDTDPYANYIHPQSYTTAMISFPQGTTLTEAYTAASKCPMPYTRNYGEKYFLMDKNHPDRFVFFNIGESTFPAESNQSIVWDETIQFFR